MISIPKIPVVVALVFFVVAIGSLVQSISINVPKLAAPHWDGEPVVFIRAEPPVVPNFKTIYFNDFNPFVSFLERNKYIAEKKIKKRKTRIPKTIPNNHKPKVEIVMPILVFPPMEMKVVQPTVVGVVSLAGIHDVLVTFTGVEQKENEASEENKHSGDVVHIMTIGDTLFDWTLLDVENGVPQFQAPDGDPIRVPLKTPEAGNVISSEARASTDANDRGSSAGEKTSSDVMERLKAARDNPEKLMALLRDPKAREQLMNSKEFREMMADPVMRKKLMEQRRKLQDHFGGRRRGR